MRPVWFALSKAAAGQPAARDNYHKGQPRSYGEAKSLHVIDERIAALVDAMNCEPWIRTTASCQGHGCLFVKVPPYVAFKSTIDVAATLSKTLDEDAIRSSPTLNYAWEITARFDPESALVYALRAPGISSGKWFYATRHGVDQDFERLRLMVHKILDDGMCCDNDVPLSMKG